jgi:hypothetical protein
MIIRSFRSPRDACMIDTSYAGCTFRLIHVILYLRFCI